MFLRCLVCSISNRLALAEIFHSDVKREGVFPLLAFVTSVLPSIEDKMVCRLQKKALIQTAQMQKKALKEWKRDIKGELYLSGYR